VCGKRDDLADSPAMAAIRFRQRIKIRISPRLANNEHVFDDVSFIVAPDLTQRRGGKYHLRLCVKMQVIQLRSPLRRAMPLR
jgi:hypothetical protein